MKPAELTEHIEKVVIELLRSGVNVYINENKPAIEIHYPNKNKIEMEGEKAKEMLKKADELWEQTDETSAILETGHLVIYLAELSKAV